MSVVDRLRVYHVGRLVSWTIVALVVYITGREVYSEQQAALAACAPGCDLLGVATAGAKVVVSGALAVPTFSAWGLPVGVVLSLLFSMWLVQHVQVEPI